MPLTKLPGHRRSAPGLEWAILRRLPMATLAATLIPVFFAVASHLWPPAGAAADVARHLSTVDILTIAVVITVWTAAFTVAIGCAVVWIMKGPAYVADAYELKDSDRPRD